MDILELVRLLRAGESDRQIARLLGHNRRTVIRYRQWVTAQGLLAGELPTPAKLQRLLDATLPLPQPPPQTSSVAPYAAIRAPGRTPPASPQLPRRLALRPAAGTHDA